MSFFKRRSVVDEPNSDDEQDDTIDPELRLRTVRTAASAIEESIKSEQRAERRKSMRKSRSRFNFTTSRSRQERKPQEPPPGASSSAPAPSTTIPGNRRNVYVNHPLSAMEADHDGEPKITYARNKVRTTSAYSVRFVACLYSCPTEYTVLTFIPKNLYEQFRRIANLFFLTLVILQCERSPSL